MSDLPIAQIINEFEAACVRWGEIRDRTPPVREEMTSKQIVAAKRRRIDARLVLFALVDGLIQGRHRP